MSQQKDIVASTSTFTGASIVAPFKALHKECIGLLFCPLLTYIFLSDQGVFEKPERHFHNDAVEESTRGGLKEIITIAMKLWRY